MSHIELHTLDNTDFYGRDFDSQDIAKIPFWLNEMKGTFEYNTLRSVDTPSQHSFINKQKLMFSNR